MWEGEEQEEGSLYPQEQSSLQHSPCAWEVWIHGIRRRQGSRWEQAQYAAILAAPTTAVGPLVPQPAGSPKTYHVSPLGRAGVWGKFSGHALPTWGQEGAGSPGCVPVCQAQGHFPARPSLVHGGLSPAAERQLVGSQRDSCPYVPLSSHIPLAATNPLALWGAKGGCTQSKASPAPC